MSGGCLAVHGVEPGRIFVGDTAEIERLGCAMVLAARRQAREVEPGTVAASTNGRSALNRSTSPKVGDWLNKRLRADRRT